MSAPLRHLPAVHVLVAALEDEGAVALYGREPVTRAVRDVLARTREETKRGRATPEMPALLAGARALLAERPRLYRPVLNATGVLLHTNLGRAPIAAPVWEAMGAASGYADLELDLASGKRASRHRSVEATLTAVTGAEAVLVVNNNAAAVLLAITGLAAGKPTAVSRGHLVEIGGGFRLPTIVAAAGSPLLEIGTTNRTHLGDYTEALDRGAAVILLVHRSNFVMTGYVGEPTAAEVIGLGRERGVPVVLDLGSGALLDTANAGLPAELTVGRAVAAGFAAVCFSGDKLLGGPQAGIIAGRKEVVAALGRHPLARALRCDKTRLAGVWATFELYRRGEAERVLPIWRSLRTPAAELRARAETWREAIGAGEVVAAADAVGGGSLPEGTLPGFALAVGDGDAEALAMRLRSQAPPVVGHIVEGRVLLHPRTIAPEDEDALVASVRAALGVVGGTP